MADRFGSTEMVAKMAAYSDETGSEREREGWESWANCSSRNHVYRRKTTTVTSTTLVTAPGVQKVIDASPTQEIKAFGKTALEAYGPKIIGAANVRPAACHGIVRTKAETCCSRGAAGRNDNA